MLSKDVENTLRAINALYPELAASIFGGAPPLCVAGETGCEPARPVTVCGGEPVE